MRTPTRHIIHTLLPLTITTILAMLPASAFAATEAPVKENVASHIGWEANETTGGTVCNVISGNKCQPAKQSTEPGGFESAVGVAVNDDPASPNYHDIYVADGVAGRVTVLSPGGQFVSTFGSKGGAAGQFEDLRAITVDPASGNVYVSDVSIVAGERVWRLQEFTAEGVFLRKVGGPITSANALAFGPGDVLYVGEERRVQEFEADGKEKGEIALPQTIPTVRGGNVNALAVDRDGNVYLTYGETDVARGGTVYKLDPEGQILDEYGLSPREPGATVEARALALDPAGRLAVAEYEEKPGVGGSLAHRGVLYDTSSGHLRQITEFANVGNLVQGGSSGIRALVFNDKDEMFATVLSVELYKTPAEYDADEVVAFTPVPVGEFVPGAAACKPGTDDGSDATVDCALNGEMDPWEVADSEAWFKWGTTLGLGERTATQSVCTSGCGKTSLPLTPTVLKGLLPNETIYFQLDGEDANVKTPEVLGSETVSFQTETVAPRIVGEPSASFIKAFSAVFSGAVNPENANTTYGFQYAPVSACEALEAQQAHPVSLEECPGVAEVQAGESSEYGSTATTAEASGLQPSTSYRYRLYAKNAAGGAIGETGGTALPEGVFTTAPAPVPQVSTGAASMIGATSATLSGSVNADGQPAVYTLELGVYEGTATQYGIVLSATASAGPVGIEQAVSGLQPGTTYAYRVSVSSVYVPSEDHTLHGTPVTFTTLGVPAVLSVPTVLAQLPVPAITIPKEAEASKPKARSKTKKTKRKAKTKAKGRAHKRKTGKSKARKGGK